MVHACVPWPPRGQACQQSGKRKPVWKQLRTLSMRVRSPRCSFEKPEKQKHGRLPEERWANVILNVDALEHL